MLTRDLLLHRRRQGRIHPQLIDPTEPEALALAGDLIEIAALGVGQSVKDVEEALGARASTHRKIRVSKGLVKLVSDRLEVAEPEGDPAAARWEAFTWAQGVLDSLDEGATIEDLEGALARTVKKPLAELRAELYADLPECRTVQGWRSIGPRALLERYSLAQVQGLVVYARRLELTVRDRDLVRARRLLRWLKFCRLVAEIERREEALRVVIEGPLALFGSTKKYGLQLASFVSAVPLLERFELEASIELPRNSPLSLKMTEADGLVSPLKAGLGHVPEEIARVLDAFADDEWEADLLPEPRTTGATGFCIPDVRFVHRTCGEEVAIELFHRWHRAALERRLGELETRPDPGLYLGVDRELVKDEDLAVRVAAAPCAFVFNGFPTRRVFKQLLAGHGPVARTGSPGSSTRASYRPAPSR